MTRPTHSFKFLGLPQQTGGSGQNPHHQEIHNLPNPATVTWDSLLYVKLQ